MRTLTALALALSLSACATSGAHLTPIQVAEKAETDAELAYVGLATSLNAIEIASPGKRASAEALKRQAWEALVHIRTAYAAGQVIDASILANVAAQAGALQGAK